MQRWSLARAFTIACELIELCSSLFFFFRWSDDRCYRQRGLFIFAGQGPDGQRQARRCRGSRQRQSRRRHSSKWFFFLAPEHGSGFDQLFFCGDGDATCRRPSARRLRWTSSTASTAKSKTAHASTSSKSRSSTARSTQRYVQSESDIPRQTVVPLFHTQVVGKQSRSTKHLQNAFLTHIFRFRVVCMAPPLSKK